MNDNARDIAVRALRDRDGNVSAYLRRLLNRSELDPTEKGLAAELALGTVRRRRTLESVLRAFLAHPDKRLATPLTEILHVGLYQLLFLARVPEFAAVNEAVEQAGRFRHRRQSGMVNGVLRTVVRSISPIQQGRPPLAPDVIPVGPDAYRTTDKAVFRDPSERAVEHLADAYSLPTSLVERWMKRFATPEKVAEVATHANVRAPLVLRINSRKATVAEVQTSLADEGTESVPHANGLSLVLPSHQQRSLSHLAAFRDGLFQPQDPTATSVGIATEVKPGMKVLDFCAAPGTKTTHMAELMGDEGSILAADVSDVKLDRVRSNCDRLGIAIVETMLSENTGSLPTQDFDRVLADVPCSNTGVLARRAEARWAFDEVPLSNRVKDQKFIIQAASLFVRPGGRLIYSTCSIEPEECDDIVRWFRGREPRFSLLHEQLTLPGGEGDPTRWHDGGYVAVLEA